MGNNKLNFTTNGAIHESISILTSILTNAIRKIRLGEKKGGGRVFARFQEKSILPTTSVARYDEMVKQKEVVIKKYSNLPAIIVSAAIFERRPDKYWKKLLIVSITRNLSKKIYLLPTLHDTEEEMAK